MITLDGLFLGPLSAMALAGVSLIFPLVMVVLHIANSGMGGAISSALDLAADEQKCSHGERAANMFPLFSVGQEMIANLIRNPLFALHNHPCQFHKLRR